MFLLLRTSWLIENGKTTTLLFTFLLKILIRKLKKKFLKFLSSCFFKEFPVNKIIRLGKHIENNDRHRPVLVVLQDESNKTFLLTNSSKLHQHDSYKSVYLSPDRTKFERLKYKKLVEELKERRSKGETNLIIRNNAIIARPSQPKQSSAGRGTASTHQPMVPANNQVRPSSSQHPN